MCSLTSNLLWYFLPDFIYSSLLNINSFSCNPIRSEYFPCLNLLTHSNPTEIIILMQITDISSLYIFSKQNGFNV